MRKLYNELSELLSIDSISGNDPACQHVCSWLEYYFDNIGFKSETIHTPYGPLVYAEFINLWNKKRPTILFYCHADVQPPDPIEQWNSPPFKMTIKNGKIYARGVSDSKGHLFAYIKGIENAINKEPLLVNIKFIIDCDEEANQRSLPWYIKRYSKKLKADVVIVAAGAMVKKNTPSICYGYRGILAIEMKVRTLKHNLHSGSFGGIVLNSLEGLAGIIDSFKDSDNKIRIPGFYDDCIIINDEGLASIQLTQGDLLKITGAKNIWHEKGFTPQECLSIRPTCEINGIHGGSSEKDFQYIIPAESVAKISFRLVPNQNPDDIFKKIKAFIKDVSPSNCSVSIKKVDSAFPSVINRKTPMANKIGGILGKSVHWYREGGCVAVVHDFKKHICDDIFMIGFGSADDNIHAPNEKLNVKDFLKEIDFAHDLVTKL